MNAYIVDVQPDGPYWNVRVPAIQRSTQARSLQEVDAMAKDLVEIMTEEKDPVLDVRLHIPQEAQEAVELHAQSKELARRALESQRKAARSLHLTGMSYRDIGKILGISYQRAHQLATA